MTQPPRAYDVGQPDFDPAIGQRLEILLEGNVVTQVLAYDCDKGTVTRNATDEQGNIRVNAARDAIETETLTGTVEVRFKA